MQDGAAGAAGFPGGMGERGGGARVPDREQVLREAEGVDGQDVPEGTDGEGCVVQAERDFV